MPILQRKKLGRIDSSWSENSFKAKKLLNSNPKIQKFSIKVILCVECLKIHFTKIRFFKISSFIVSQTEKSIEP